MERNTLVKGVQYCKEFIDKLTCGAPGKFHFSLGGTGYETMGTSISEKRNEEKRARRKKGSLYTGNEAGPRPLSRSVGPIPFRV